jgi:hypothetical protein
MELPSLAWLEAFRDSVALALDSSVQFEVLPSVNPLVYKIRFKLGTTVSGPNFMLVWNLFQMFAAHNGVVPQGKAEREGNRLTATVVVKRRFGPERNAHPGDAK